MRAPRPRRRLAGDCSLEPTRPGRGASALRVDGLPPPPRTGLDRCDRLGPPRVPPRPRASRDNCAMIPAEQPLTVRLEGSLVVLEPLAPEHTEGRWAAAQPDEIWAWLTSVGKSRDRFDLWMRMSLDAADTGAEGPFAIRSCADGVPLIGSSRYLNVRRPDRVVEVGWSWLTPSAWRSGANVETKLLMLGHAFETLGCVRVEFKTDARNERSRAALAALPAQFEGVMRNHMIVPDVGQRDSAYYSVIDEEWPEVRANLRRRLDRRVG